MQELLLELFTKIGFLSINPKDYVDPGDPVGNKEKLIGNMNDLEKVCYTFLENQRTKHKQLHATMHDSESDSDEYQKAESEHSFTHSVEEAVRGIMWSSIKSRFASPKGSTGWSLRKDFQIVATFEEEKEPFGGFAGFTVIRLGSMNFGG